jgi:hypothetical protein
MNTTRTVTRGIFLILCISLAIITIGCSSSSDNSNGSSSGGCCGCGGCSGCCGGCCGGDDSSTDANSDGNLASENIPTSLGTTTTTQQSTAVSVCSNLNINAVSATASKSQTTGGYSYSYSYTIRACASTVGYNLFLADGTNTVSVSAGQIAYQGKETTGSNSYTSSRSFTQFCVKTSDSKNTCVPIS